MESAASMVFQMLHEFEFKLLNGIIKIIMHVFQSLNSNDNFKKKKDAL